MTQLSIFRSSSPPQMANLHPHCPELYASGIKANCFGKDLASPVGYSECDEELSDIPQSHGFVALLNAYRASGGTTQGEHFSQLLEKHRRGDCMSLARLIASRTVFGFEWRGSLWIPMFQFEPKTLAAKSGPGQVLAELASDMQPWDLATWFVRPNPWLENRKPVDEIDTAMATVLNAARTERFLTTG
jgi:hypothetical protein